MTKQTSRPILPLAERLDRDLRAAAKSLSAEEARFLVKTYYTIQEDRKRASHQAGTLEKAAKPHELLSWIGEQNKRLETDIKLALDVYAHNNPIGRWSMGILGIGPIIAAGLLAHIWLDQAPSPAHIWRYAGLDPSQKWAKASVIEQRAQEIQRETHDGFTTLTKLCAEFGRSQQRVLQAMHSTASPDSLDWKAIARYMSRRPWNADLKVLCWKIGDSFVKVSNNPKSLYGRLYREYKAKEAEKNESGAFAAQALAFPHAAKLTKENQKLLAAGRLTPGWIDMRARRRTVKLFLAHWHEVAWKETYGTEPPVPYAIAQLQHVHRIPVPYNEKGSEEGNE